MSDFDTVSLLNRQHTENLANILANPESRKVAETWFDTDTVDAWRHARMYACLDPLLTAYPDARWLTVGDSHFGKDAHYIQQKGASALATDISDPLLKLGADRGYIREFGTENAESLSFEDESFDFVLCKESYHHFTRPMVAVYEMLRVARTGIVLIEPNEAPRLHPPSVIGRRLIKWLLLRLRLLKTGGSADIELLRPYVDSWEDVGNYVSKISRRELEKVALALRYPACAFKGLNDYYEPGVEFERATEDSSLLKRVRERIATADRRCQIGLHQHTELLLAAIVFKRSPSQEAVDLMERAGFRVKHLPRNPYNQQSKPAPAAA